MDTSSAVKFKGFAASKPGIFEAADEVSYGCLFMTE